MAKDDYSVILYRLLVYTYACKKRNIIFEKETFDEAVRKDVENDQYFYDILDMAQKEGFIEGVSLRKAWGGDKILLSDLEDIEITPAGIRYLNDNAKMRKIGEGLREAADIIAKLATMAMLFV